MQNLTDYPTAFYAANYACLNQPLVERNWPARAWRWQRRLPRREVDFWLTGVVADAVVAVVVVVAGVAGGGRGEATP